MDMTAESNLDLMFNLRMGSQQMEAIDRAVALGIAKSRSDFIRRAIDLKLEGLDPDIRNAMARFLIALVQELAPTLQASIERMNPETLDALRSLDAGEVAEHFTDLLSVSEHTLKTIEHEADKAKLNAQPRRGRKLVRK